MLTGNKEDEVKGVIVSLDTIEEVIDEAIREKANLIISHHPIIFSGLKSLTGKNYIERVIIKAIKNNIAIYAIHTNLDNVFEGVNLKIAKQLDLRKVKILSPKKNTLIKLSVYVPVNALEEVKNAVFEAGAGNIGNYSHCSFSSEGLGTFKANKEAKPFVGSLDIIHSEKEAKLEVIVPLNSQGQVISALLNAHPYEEVAYDLFPILNKDKKIGSGMIGYLDAEKDEHSFLKMVKERLNTA